MEKRIVIIDKRLIMCYTIRSYDIASVERTMRDLSTLTIDTLDYVTERIYALTR